MTAADALLEGLNPQQRAAVLTRAARCLSSRGGIGQDEVFTHRIAYLVAERGSPLRDHGDHVHQQGRGRDGGLAQADRGAVARDVAADLPLGVRADPAQGGGQVRLSLLVHDLRRRRLRAADGAGLPRARPGSEVPPAEGDGRAGLHAEERTARLRDGRGARVRLPREGAGRGVRGIPAAAGRGRGDGLRRPDHGHRQPAAGLR